MDVLKILVMANYKFIPSLDDILELSAVTRLRNQLLETEHYQLAVEVRLFVCVCLFVLSKLNTIDVILSLFGYFARCQPKVALTPVGCGRLGLLHP